LLVPLSAWACGPKVQYVKMERTPCMGKCPWYTLEVFEDGRVQYNGKKDAKMQGKHQGKIDPKKAQAFLKMVARKKVHKAKGHYDSNISDLPMIHYLFKIDEEIKEIRQANFGPQYFQSIAAEMDGLLADVEWRPMVDRMLE